MKTNNKGFSLVELIVVIAIMAILAAVAIPTFAGFINKANVASDDSYANDIKYACEISFASIGEVQSVTVQGEKEGKWATITVKVKPASATEVSTYTITNGQNVSYGGAAGVALQCAQEAIGTIDTTYTFKTDSYKNAK